MAGVFDWHRTIHSLKYGPGLTDGSSTQGLQSLREQRDDPGSVCRRYLWHIGKDCDRACGASEDELSDYKRGIYITRSIGEGA